MRGGPRGGRSQPLRPMSHPLDPDRSTPALLIYSPLDIYGWPLWRQSIGPDGPLLSWSTVVLRVLCFVMFFQEKQLRHF